MHALPPMGPEAEAEENPERTNGDDKNGFNAADRS